MLIYIVKVLRFRTGFSCVPIGAPKVHLFSLASFFSQWCTWQIAPGEPEGANGASDSAKEAKRVGDAKQTRDEMRLVGGLQQGDLVRLQLNDVELDGLVLWADMDTNPWKSNLEQYHNAVGNPFVKTFQLVVHTPQQSEA